MQDWTGTSRHCRPCDPYQLPVAAEAQPKSATVVTGVSSRATARNSNLVVRSHLSEQSPRCKINLGAQPRLSMAVSRESPTAYRSGVPLRRSRTAQDFTVGAPIDAPSRTRSTTVIRP